MQLARNGVDIYDHFQLPANFVWAKMGGTQDSNMLEQKQKVYSLADGE